MSDNLPPLPQSFTILSRLQSGTEEVVPLDMVRDYGQQCYQQALEDAEQMLMAEHERRWHIDDHAFFFAHKVRALGEKASEFTTSVPARPERDDDLVLSAAADEIERLRATLDRQQLSYEREREIDQDEIERLIALRRDDARVLDAERAGRAAAVLAMREAAAELERHKPLMQAVEWILDDGHMNQEHLARLRAAWEAV